MVARLKMRLKHRFLSGEKGKPEADIDHTTTAEENAEAPAIAQNDNVRNEIGEMKGEALKLSFQTLVALEYDLGDVSKREKFIKDGVEQDHYDGKCAIQGNIDFTIAAAEEVIARSEKENIISGLKKKLGIEASEIERNVIERVKTALSKKEITETDLSRDEMSLVNSRLDKYPGLKKNPFVDAKNYIKELKLLNHKRFENFLKHYQLLEYARADAQVNIVTVKRLGKQLAEYRSSLEEKPWKKESGSPRFMRAQELKNEFKKEHLRILQEDFNELPKIIGTRKNTFRIRSEGYQKWLETVGEAQGFISLEEQKALRAIKGEVKSYRRDAAFQLIQEKENRIEGNDPQEIFLRMKDVMEDEIDRAHNMLSSEIQMASLALAFLDVQESKEISNTDVVSEERENLKTSINNVVAQKTFLQQLVYAYKVMCVQEQPLLFTNTFDTPAVAGVEYKGIQVPECNA